MASSEDLVSDVSQSGSADDDGVDDDVVDEGMGVATRGGASGKATATHPPNRTTLTQDEQDALLMGGAVGADSCVMNLEVSGGERRRGGALASHTTCSRRLFSCMGLNTLLLPVQVPICVYTRTRLCVNKASALTFLLHVREGQHACPCRMMPDEHPCSSLSGE